MRWKLFARLRGALASSRATPEQLVRSQYQEFQRLLEANDAALERMGALGDLLERAEPFAHGGGARLAAEALENARRMVASLVRLSGGRYTALHRRLDAIGAEAQQALAGGTAGLPGSSSLRAPELPYAVSLDQVGARHLAIVGGKMASLGEIRNVLGLPVPAGFCITQRWLDEALDATDLRRELEALTSRLDLQDAAGLQGTCEQIQGLLSSVPIPPAAEAAVLGAYDAMCRGLGADCCVAVRASVAGEHDCSHFFAGLHPPALNVPRGGLVDACWQVLVSKYSPRSVTYRILNGLRDEDMRMNVGCLPMLGEGLRQIAIPDDQRQLASLTPSEAAQLTAHASAIEKHFGAPQDVEWAITEAGEIFILQARPLLARRGEEPAGTGFASSTVYRAVAAAAGSIVPLGLTDPHASYFTPQGCRTAHDITRFCHEMAVREMFEVNKNTASRRMSRVCRLAFTVPLETFVIDLGGGLAAGAGEQSVQPEDITSTPFRALIAGMSTPGLPWSGAVPIELRGFASLVINSMIDTERAAAELGSDAYVLVSEQYVNYSARMGYHFASLDAYASGSLHRNYISYRFKGGAAAAVRRVRRARFIAYVLRHWGFSVVQRADHVDATIRKVPEPEVLALLRELGRLLGAVRNADVSMYSDDQIELYAEAFLAGACSPVDATQGKLRGPPR